MAEFKTVKVSVSFEVSVLGEELLHRTKPIERVMEDALDNFPEGIRALIRGKNYAVSDVIFVTEADNKQCSMTMPASRVVGVVK